MAKKFKTLDEQIDILEKRNLTICNKDDAKKFLLHNNYYRVSGFSLTLRDHDVFFDKASFQNIVDIYSFDHELRHILLKYIEIIEVSIKSVYAYLFAQKNSPLGYRTSSYFTDLSEHLTIINKAETQLEKNKSYEAYLKHYIEDLKEDLPLWVFVELFTISDISRLYKISEKDLKDQIAKIYGFTANSGSDLMEKYLHGMTILRNLCAHGSRLYNRLFITKPSLNSKEKKILNKDEEGVVDNSHLFGYVINMKRLISKEDFEDLKTEILAISKKYPFVDLKYYGFNPDWNNLL